MTADYRKQVQNSRQIGALHEVGREPTQFPAVEYKVRKILIRLTTCAQSVNENEKYLVFDSNNMVILIFRS